ncbi:exopolysaccharide biosynthesis protein [Pseudooceanicola sp.]|jgi:hypothetical protein|uniref:exopolysaccharide biosynthesis protein n=1 Tax=Pseudooceanicola sp. TaxID=1914328 RepID=UPI004059B0D9
MTTDDTTAAGNGGDLGSVTDVVERMAEAANGEKTELREITSAMGEASFVPVLMAPALAVVTPLSGIPLFSSACGLLIALVSLQMLMNRDHIWLPDFIMRRKVPSDRLRKAADWLKKPAAWLDRHSKARLGFLVRRPFDWVTEAACLVCGAAMPFLELVPFSSSTLGAAVVLFSLALLVRDGLYSVLAVVFMALLGGGAYLIVT